VKDVSQADDGARTPITHTRDLTIDALMEHFANDAMDVDEFERRVGIAHSAGTTEELKTLLADLPGSGSLPVALGGSNLTAARPKYSLAAAADVKESGYVIACLGGATRKGAWTPARTNYAVALLGGTDLDFREAYLGPGVTEVRVFALCGGVEIVVPPGVRVDCSGLGILGGFEDNASSVASPEPGAPTIRVTGVALMGGVNVVARHPGETKRDARKRRRLERREQQKRLRGRGQD
jgi:uncharacterized protein DUF1707